MPRSKRAKVSGEKEENINIQSRVASGRYNTLQDFLGDFEKASNTIIERTQSQAHGDEADESSVAEIVNRIAAFKKLLNTHVRQVYATQSNVKTEPTDGDTDANVEPAANMDIRNDHLALTLYGNPANPKQLYSSLQKPTKVPFPSSEPEGEKYVEVQAALREAGLPNGITATRISPYNPESRSTEPKRTFGEVFAPRPTLPQLDPPRRGRSASRNGSNTWVDPLDAVTDPKAFPGERANYCLAALPSGQWLQYGGVTSSPSFWNRRQKRQSSQPSGYEEDGQEPYGDPTLPEDISVLQGVYSSFAPSFDSSGAVVQVDSKDLVWWGKRGASRLNTLFSAQYEEPDGESTIQPGNIGDLDESTLEEMVNTFKEEDFADNAPDNALKGEEDQMSKDLDELLRDISELLETLSSYQRVRNLDPPVPGKGGESEQESPDLGDPNTPSGSEKAVYETLKSSLAAMISNLPPYAVAKLDGEQLAELNISQKIVVENPDYYGTMERDDYTLQQERMAAMGPVGGANRTATPRSAGYNQRIYHPGVRLQQAQGSFHTPQTYYGRQGSISGAYTAAPAATYTGARMPTTPSQRSNYLPGYSQGNAVPQFQRPAPNGYNPYSAQQGAASAQGSQSPYTPRPAVYNAQYGAGRSASPQKPPHGIPQSRSPHISPGPANQQQRYLPQRRQPPRYGSHSPNQESPQNSYPNSAAATAYARSVAEQTALMNRNRAQLAARQSPPTPRPTA